MKWPQFRADRRKATIDALYGMIVAQARSPIFYQDFGVPDTVNGRFDAIVLHAALFLTRIESETETVRSLGQGVFDAFCRDMDENLREMGVSDLSVPKEMRRMGEAFYGRAGAYRAALAADGDAALEEALLRNLFGGRQEAAAIPALAAYARAAVARLQETPSTAIAGGALDWPSPEAYIPEKQV
jgi:cytochrome b pre-mRNA-processing protein 3